MNEAASSLFWIVLCIVVAPLVAGLIPRRRIPEVVLLLVLGVVVGPNVLDLAETGDAIGLLRELGLGLLFLLAGYELELEELTGRAGRRALWTWLACLATALTLVWLIGLSGVIHAEAAVAIALTSTALGTLLPILKDNGILGSALGTTVMHHGAYGELGPIVAMAVLLGTRGPVASLLVLAGFAVLAFVVSLFSASLQREGSRLLNIIRAGAETTAQTTVRLTMLLLVTLGVLAAAFDLDAVLGAFAAGLVLRRLIPAGHEGLELRLNGLAFGLLIPIFFVTSGMAIDPAAVASAPGELLVFVALIAVVRGGWVFVAERFFRRRSGRNSLVVALFAITGLPIIVAVSSAAVSAGQMTQHNASVLVAGGALTVLVGPLAATLLMGRAGPHTAVDDDGVVPR
jgi:Kef-type K+ transport system membrane component KefB